MRKLIPIEEAAEILGISKLTLYKYVSQKRIKHVKIGSKVMFREEDLEMWIQSNLVESTNS